ncbi:DUF1822 family protein [Phormidium sp. FACHB-592]|uniref:DUF1822 family protein n=1 Tax=Stenomitos frigidus AS-A4 TaxID=2933935 RepID=A0ABV0KT22_9CYAN|nr:DUF1822 family protein [Phormidium sp. FACHB-592]MBD2073323.1 DUF1822 family protein [Phormidium sp. FACHB-592]
MSLPDTLTELRLEIPPEIHQESWQHSQSASNPLTQWNTYLNQVCLNTVLPWLQAEHTPEASAWSGAVPLLGELVRGTAIDLGDQRLILIPDKTVDTSELQVPQEWIDLPAWAGDYYLAVQVDPDDLCLHIWAYTTHAQLKTLGTYDGNQRTYVLDAYDLVQDLSVLWVVRQFPNELTRTEIAPLSPLPAAQAENLLQRLSNPAVLQPRLEIPFHLWAALIAKDDWQQRLGRSRRSELSSATITRTLANLSQWLQNRFDESWQTLEELGMVTEAFNVRKDDRTQRSIRRAKRLRLPDQDTLLLVVVEPEADGRVSIRSQLRPLDPSVCLPETLSLTLLSATGETIQAVQARDRDNVIQLKRFKCPPETQFRLQVAIDNTVIGEDFVV